jgi:hypothetical protein
MGQESMGVGNRVPEDMSASTIKPRHEGAFFKPPRVFKKRDAGGWPIGPRTERRQKENRELNKLPDSIKNFCEIRLPGCLRNKMLSWAHATKSRFILTSKDWQTAVRSCLFCHQKIESMPHAKMFKLVADSINRRRLE